MLRLAVVIIGAPEQVYPERWARVLVRYPQMKEEEWDLDGPNIRLSASLDQANIPYLDLLPVFRAAAEQGGTDLHFNRRRSLDAGRAPARGRDHRQVRDHAFRARSVTWPHPTIQAKYPIRAMVR